MKASKQPWRRQPPLPPPYKHYSPSSHSIYMHKTVMWVPVAVIEAAGLEYSISNPSNAPLMCARCSVVVDTTPITLIFNNTCAMRQRFCHRIRTVDACWSRWQRRCSLIAMAASVPSIHQRLTRRTKVRYYAIDEWIRLKPLHPLLMYRPYTTESALDLDELTLLFYNHLNLGRGFCLRIGTSCNWQNTEHGQSISYTTINLIAHT